MTKLKIKSKRKIKCLKYMVDTGEYSAGYALQLLENFNDNGLVLDADYEPFAEYLENLINQEEMQKEVIEENPVEDTEAQDEAYDETQDEAQETNEESEE